MAEIVAIVASGLALAEVLKKLVLPKLIELLRSKPTTVSTNLQQQGSALALLPRFEPYAYNIAVAGTVNTGKSSLVEALLKLWGNHHANDAGVPVTVKPGVTAVKHAFGPNAFLWDLPGAGTTECPAAQYFRDMCLSSFDCVLLVTSDTVREADATVMKACIAKRQHIAMVYNKADEALSTELRKGSRIRATDSRAAADALRQRIGSNLRAVLGQPTAAGGGDRSVDYFLLSAMALSDMLDGINSGRQEGEGLLGLYEFGPDKALARTGLDEMALLSWMQSVLRLRHPHSPAGAGAGAPHWPPPAQAAHERYPPVPVAPPPTPPLPVCGAAPLQAGLQRMRMPPTAQPPQQPQPHQPLRQQQQAAAAASPPQAAPSAAPPAAAVLPPPPPLQRDPALLSTARSNPAAAAAAVAAASFPRHAIPSEFICPITQDVMSEPVVTADGHSYNRPGIEQWLAAGNATSPRTNLPLVHTHLVPNKQLRSAIAAWSAQAGYPLPAAAD